MSPLTSWPAFSKTNRYLYVLSRVAKTMSSVISASAMAAPAIQRSG
jgi:hypothetical protein